MATWERRTVRNGDIELAVFERGSRSGPTVVLVHGWPDTHHLWNRVAERLADEFRLVAYDTRGMGESTDPGTLEAFGLAHLATDFFAVLDAVSPDAQVHVLAHDWGSIGVWEAVCEPGAEARVASFTSISGPNLDHLASWARGTLKHPTAGRLGRLVQQVLSFSYVGFFVSPAGPPVLRRLASVQRWGSFLRRTDGVRPRPGDLASTLPEDMVSGLRYYRANVASSLAGSRERRTTVPVLVLKPTRDPAVRAVSYADTERWVEQVERHDVPYGHWVPLSEPGLVAEVTAEFIRRHA